jgi:phosphoribosyl 1,2-cyclic phosphate phosphodiesterase
MKLTFLGTGTSQGVPVIGCDCHVCQSADPHNRRSRTSALLSVYDRNILIDAGPDFRNQALAARIQHLDAVLLTHHHFDHIAGLDDMRPITELYGTLPIYGSPITLQDVRHRFDYAFSETLSQGSTRPLLQLVPVTKPFHIDTVPIHPLDILHGMWTITAYRIGSLVYITDASTIPAATMDLLHDVDVLVLNALRYKPHPTHFSLDEALAVIAEIQPRRAFLVHLTHAFDHSIVNAALPSGIQLAWDGLEIDIDDPLPIHP